MLEMKDREQLNMITKEIVDKVVRLLQDDVYKIVLFGSYAKGTFTRESDIDIMILLNCDKDKVLQYRKTISRLSSRLGLENDIEISLLLRDRKTFEDGKDILPFYKNIKEEGITLYE
ncbi:MAG: nucleotidyltransferase domain-containing protein [Blautia sp.]|nr:nucleotidyltransferase domain-containing protein [Blautia sp.]